MLVGVGEPDEVLAADDVADDCGGEPAAGEDCFLPVESDACGEDDVVMPAVVGDDSAEEMGFAEVYGCAVESAEDD